MLWLFFRERSTLQTKSYTCYTCFYSSYFQCFILTVSAKYVQKHNKSDQVLKKSLKYQKMSGSEACQFSPVKRKTKRILKYCDSATMTLALCNKVPF